MFIIQVITYWVAPMCEALASVLVGWGGTVQKVLGRDPTFAHATMATI